MSESWQIVWCFQKKIGFKLKKYSSIIYGTSLLIWTKIWGCSLLVLLTSQDLLRVIFSIPARFFFEKIVFKDVQQTVLIENVIILMGECISKCNDVWQGVTFPQWLFFDISTFCFHYIQFQLRLIYEKIFYHYYI